MNHYDNIHFENSIDEILEDPNKRKHYSELLKGEHVLIIKNAYPEKLCREITHYLTQVGQSSLPNYQPIVEGASNNHRINRKDERSYVQGCFHQFSFYPWNQDVFDFFNLFRKSYFLKNVLNNIPESSYVGMSPERDCISRLSFQFYPSGKGFLNKHKDPVDYHQLVLPLLMLTTKGVDFNEGGAYVELKGEKILLEDYCSCGDLVIFNATFPHGVDVIDEKVEVPWTSFQGRWMLLFAVNKLSHNKEISNAIDLTK